jgi:NAD(P)-dependent dehydrogenase (short-subunit alcohol dehydrogenase family)
MSGIKDKVVVITGASSGIGEAAAVMLAERGAKVVLGARGLVRLEALLPAGSRVRDYPPSHRLRRDRSAFAQGYSESVRERARRIRRCGER